MVDILQSHSNEEDHMLSSQSFKDELRWSGSQIDKLKVTRTTHSLLLLVLFLLLVRVSDVE